MAWSVVNGSVWLRPRAVELFGMTREHAICGGDVRWHDVEAPRAHSATWIECRHVASTGKLSL